MKHLHFLTSFVLVLLAGLGHDLILKNHVVLQQPPSSGCVKSPRLRAQCSSCAKCGFPQHVALKKGCWISCGHDDFWVFPLFFGGVKHIALDFSFCFSGESVFSDVAAEWHCGLDSALCWLEDHGPSELFCLMLQHLGWQQTCWTKSSRDI